MIVMQRDRSLLLSGSCCRLCTGKGVRAEKGHLPCYVKVGRPRIVSKPYSFTTKPAEVALIGSMSTLVCCMMISLLPAKPMELVGCPWMGTVRGMMILPMSVPAALNTYMPSSIFRPLKIFKGEYIIVNSKHSLQYEV